MTNAKTSPESSAQRSEAEEGSKRRKSESAVIHQPAATREKERRVGMDRGLNIPDSFFEPLPEKLQRAFEGAED